MPKIKTTTLMLLTAVLSACATSEPKPMVPRLTATGVPVLHAIDSEDLRLLMARMNNLMQERNLTDQEMDVQRRQASSKVIEAAKGVEQAIDGILAAESKLNLEAGEDKVFRSLALNLKSEAQTLKVQALTQQTEAIPGTLEKMNVTCNSCHELFRDTSIPGAKL